MAEIVINSTLQYTWKKSVTEKLKNLPKQKKFKQFRLVFMSDNYLNHLEYISSDNYFRMKTRIADLSKKRFSKFRIRWHLFWSIYTRTVAYFSLRSSADDQYIYILYHDLDHKELLETFVKNLGEHLDCKIELTFKPDTESGWGANDII